MSGQRAEEYCLTCATFVICCGWEYPERENRLFLDKNSPWYEYV